MGRITISFTSTSADCSIANAIARAIASGGIANLSRDSASWAFTSGFFDTFREIRPDEARRNDRHAQLIAGLLAQTLGDGAHGELRAGIDRLVRYSLMSCCRSDVDEMPETLLAEDRQRCGDAVQNTSR